jgi:hypothetical protein
LLSADNEDVLAPWHSLLLCSPPGWYCIDWGQLKCILFHVSCRGMSLFLPLHGQGSVRNLVVPASMAGMFVSSSDLHGRLDALVPFELFFGDAAVYELELSIQSVCAAAMSLRVVAAVKVDPSSSSRRVASAGLAENGGAFTDSGSEPAYDSEQDSEVQSLVSSADTGFESDAEGSPLARHSEDEQPPIVEVPHDDGEDDVRATRGVYVVWSNGYFTLTDNPNWPDVKISALPRWTQPTLLGTTMKSKTVVPSHFGDSRESPARAYAVCRAWSIWRARQGQFLVGCSSRVHVFSQELQLLRAELQALGHGGRTGNLRADALIEGWVPEAFQGL